MKQPLKRGLEKFGLPNHIHGKELQGLLWSEEKSFTKKKKRFNGTCEGGAIYNLGVLMDARVLVAKGKGGGVT